jgi:hypothetical protein
MCDDVAVRWSEFEATRRNIQDEERNNICRAIDSYIEQCKANPSVNNYFLAGLEVALDIASDVDRHTPPRLNQPTLF